MGYFDTLAGGVVIFSHVQNQPTASVFLYAYFDATQMS